MIASTVAAAQIDGALRLSDWGLIRAIGPDARSFLHGQLTQDMQQLKVGQSHLAGYCSAKGRLLASFVVWPVADEELLLACSADLLPAMLKRLSMYVLRAKCKLSDAGPDRALWGASGTAARQAFKGQSMAAWDVAAEQDGRVIRLPDAWVDGQSVPRCLLDLPATAPAPALPALDLAPWLALEALSGVPRIMTATSEQFVPQMVNLELVGGVNFQKGCYPGQEVVARSQYRGTLKRRGFVVSADSAMAPGQEIFHSADRDQPAGLVALAGSSRPGRYEALAELKLSAVADGSLHLGGPDGPALQVGTLPYTVPLDAA